ncbi:NHL repeat-containing protein [Paenibacillus mendelii]|uniref:NHL repeat-containing protein n=1 Tax=Paenibacillus mendelii TaxID=206163 RepID=A0ABV6JDI7_9BACL|nr:NHL repeat-containing protein [Paenibacillus mendelii]MCQ6563536.1 NHL repeat-containing protein [Paenibacillus mendelii]
MKKQLTYRWLASLLAGIVIAAGIASFPVRASAELPYRTYTSDDKGKLVDVQAAYVPDTYLYVFLEGDIPGWAADAPPTLNQPDDLFLDQRNHLYIADTGNNRIIELGADRQPVRVYGTEEGEGSLSAPRGIFVTEDGMLYVADSKNMRIAVFDQGGRFIKQYNKPETDFLPESFLFEPIKLVVDKRGFIYVATHNGYQGLLLLDDIGVFQGFYGANRTERTFTETLKRMFYTEQQLSKEIMKIPGSVSNVTLGPDGFLYTTSVSVKQGQVKKLDFFGRDMLGERIASLAIDTMNLDVAVGQTGSMSVLDAGMGEIRQYNALGELLFVFSSKDNGYNKVGLLKQPAAIAIEPSGTLNVLEKTLGVIQRFRPTEFAGLVHEANEKFMAGEYESSAGPWKEVLHLNTKFNMAQLGLAKASFKQRDWEQARYHYRSAGDKVGYSDSFWYVRLEWMNANASGLLTTASALLALGLAGRFIWIRRKEGRKRDAGGDSIETGAGK